MAWLKPWNIYVAKLRERGGKTNNYEGKNINQYLCSAWINNWGSHEQAFIWTLGQFIKPLVVEFRGSDSNFGYSMNQTSTKNKRSANVQDFSSTKIAVHEFILERRTRKTHGCQCVSILNMSNDMANLCVALVEETAQSASFAGKRPPTAASLPSTSGGVPVMGLAQ